MNNKLIKRMLKCVLMIGLLLSGSSVFTLEVKAEETVASVVIDETNFPDVNFRAYVLENVDSDGNGELTYEEIQKATELNVSEMSITSLKGMEYFTQLTKLDCHSNNLISLDVSNHTALTYLSCGGNELTNLDVSNNTALIELWCSHNQLTNLDLGKNTVLAHFGCWNNHLTSLDVSNNVALIRLYCNDNELTCLDVSNNVALTTLYCTNNRLTSLDVSNNTALTDLMCGNTIFWCPLEKVTDLPGFDPAKASNWRGADYDAESGILKDINSIGVMYTYDCGNGYSGTFSFEIIHHDENADGYCDACAQQTSFAIDETSFPDTNFRAYVQKNIDSDGDNILEFEEIKEVSELTVSNMSITSLAGIEYFTQMFYLDCSGNQLTSLDVSNNVALTTLDCADNQLTSLGVSNTPALTYLYCKNNQLTSLNVSNNTALTCLYCENNQLTSLDVSNNTALIRLYCDGNQLTSLDVSNNTALTQFSCCNNTAFFCPLKKVTVLPGFDPAKASDWNGAIYDAESGMLTNITDVTVTYSYDCGSGYSETFSFEVLHYDENADGCCDGCAQPTSFIIDETSFPDANFRKYVLRYIDTDGDGILEFEEATEVNILNVEEMSITSLKGIEYFTQLTHLFCRENQLTSLDVSKNIVLERLDCSYNQLESLDVSNNFALTYLNCYCNRCLTSLNISMNTALDYLDCMINQLTILDVSNNTALTYLYCGNNQLTSLDVSNNSSLKYLYAEDNETTFCISEKITTLPGFDPAKVGIWINADYDAESEMLTNIIGNIVTYTYDCGNGYSETFTLYLTDHADSDENGLCDNCGKNLQQESEPEPDTSINGVVLGADNLWAYYVNGVVDTTFTGLASNESGTWYIENGYLNWDYTELFCWTDGWYYVMSGRVPTEYTGLVRNSEGLWYVENGKINFTYTDLVSSAEGWFYVMEGRVTEEYTGLVRNSEGMWYVENGMINWEFTDLVSDVEGWFYVMEGRVTEEYTGLVSNSAGTWYIAAGKLDWEHTGLVSSVTGWWYVLEGRVTEEYVGLVANENGVWYVENGSISFEHEGLVNDATGWWYVTGSQVATDYTGLATNDAGTWYVQNGYLDFGFSGTVIFENVEYRVENGMITGETPEEEPEEETKTVTVQHDYGYSFDITLNEAGEMISQTYYNSDGSLAGNNTVEYTSDGRVSKITCNNADNTVTGTASYEYRDDGSVSRLIDSNPYGKAMYYAASIYFSEEGTASCYFATLYGRMHTETEFCENGNQTTTTQEFDEDGNIKKYTATTYNSLFQTIKYVEYTTDGVVKEYILYEYDATGKLVKKMRYDANDILQETTEYS